MAGTKDGSGGDKKTPDASDPGRHVEIVEIDAVLESTGSHPAAPSPPPTPPRKSVAPPPPPGRKSVPPPPRRSVLPPPNITRSATLAPGTPHTATPGLSSVGSIKSPGVPTRASTIVGGLTTPTKAKEPPGRPAHPARPSHPPPPIPSAKHPVEPATEPDLKAAPSPVNPGAEIAVRDEAATVPVLPASTVAIPAAFMAAPAVPPPPVSTGNTAAIAAPPRDDVPWHAQLERLPREAEALATSQPARAALLLATHARIAIDLREDPATGEASLHRAHALAPDLRAVALSRRWSAERRSKHTEVLTLARAEIPLVGDPRERLALLLEIAAIEDSTVGQQDAAEKALREAAALDASEPGAWDALAALHHRRGQHREAVTAWESLATALSDGTVRASLHTAVATAREVSLDDLPGATASFKRALEADPAHPGALAAIEPIHLRARAWIDYARVLVAQGDLVGEPAAARELYERAGDVLWECAGDAPSAAACYERAAAMAPREIAPLEKFGAVLEGAGRWTDLPRVYERMLQIQRDPMLQAAVLLKLGNVYETRLERIDDALKAYRRALDAHPTFTPAAQALSELYRAQQQWAEHVALESIEADRLTQPSQRASRYVSLGEILETRLEQTEAAIDRYDRALALDPGNTAAFDALDRIHRASGQWDALIAAHETLLTGARDPRRLRAVRLALAHLLLDRANDPTRAATLLKSALEGPQDDFAVLGTLARAHADAGRWADHVETLETQARLLRDDEDVLRALYRVAAVIENRLDDPRRALIAYQKVLDRSAQHEGALRAIARIQQSQSRWDEVVTVERKLLALAASPDDAALGLYRIGRVFEERLGRPDEALKAYEEAIARSAGFTPARAAVERLLRSMGRYPRLGELYEKQADAGGDRATCARAYLAAASVYELHLNDPNRAIAACEKALAIAADLAAAQWAIYRLRERLGDWTRAESMAQTLLSATTHSAARLRVLVRLARIHEYRLRDTSGAAGLYEQAIATGASAAALTYDRLRTARGEARRETVTHWLQAAATATADARLALALLRARALLVEFGGGSPDERIDAWTAALQIHGSDLAALEGVARALLLGAPDPRLPQAIRARARLAADAPSRTLLLYVAGAMSEAAGRATDADAAYNEALEIAADFFPALAGLRRLRETAGDARAMARIAQRAAAIAAHPLNLADALLDAADLYADKLDDPHEALALYRTVLARQPGHPRAYAKAFALLEKAGDWTGAAATMAQHAEAMPEADARARLLAARAALLAEKLGDARGAIVDITRALAAKPDEPALLGMLARLHEREQHWPDAAKAYEAMAKVLPDGPIKRESVLAQARIWTLHVRDYEKARALLEQLHQRDAGDRAVTEKVAELSMLLGDATRARDLLVELAKGGTAPERARALVALSEVHRKALGDHPASHAAAAQAMVLAVQDPAVVPLVEAHYQGTEDWGAFATLGDEAIAAAAPTSPGTLPLRMALARAYREKLRVLDPADAHLRAAIEHFPAAVEPRIALANGLLGGNDHAAVTEFRRVIDLDACVPAAYRGLFTVCQRIGLAGAAAIMASTVALLGEAGPHIEGALSLSVTPPPQPSALPPDDALQLLVGPTRARFVRRLLTLVDPHLHEIFSNGPDAIQGLTRVPETVAAAQSVRAVANALAAGPLMLFRGTGREAHPVLTDPRAVILGADYFTDAGAGRVVYEAAGACGRIAAASVTGVALPADQLRALCDVLTDPNADAPGYRDLRKRVGSALPRRVRKEIERVLEESPGNARSELPIWDEEEKRRAMRLGVVFSRDLRVVAQRLAPDLVAATTIEERRRALAANPAMVEALRFAASEACWAAHRRVFGQA